MTTLQEDRSTRQRSTKETARRSCSCPGQTQEESAPMPANRTRASGTTSILDAVTQVQSAIERTSSVTGPTANVSATFGRAPGNKGQRYKPTPPTIEEAFRILDALERKGQNPKLVKLGRRNRALVAFIWRSGLRIHEALLIRPVDIDAEHNQVHVLRGKGGKERWSVIDNYGLEEVDLWATMRAGLGFNSTQPMFCVIEGSNAGAHLNQSYVRLKLHEAARLAGVDKRVPCHQWRHAHALHLHRKHVPLTAISKQLGHSNVSTTSTYLSGMSSEEIRGHVLEAWK